MLSAPGKSQPDACRVGTRRNHKFSVQIPAISHVHQVDARIKVAVANAAIHRSVDTPGRFFAYEEIDLGLRRADRFQPCGRVAALESA